MPRARRVDPIAKQFGAIVWNMRAGRNWTLSDLGRFAGMSADYLGLIEQGRNMPSLTTVLRLASAFGVPTGSMLDQIETPWARPR